MSKVVILFGHGARDPAWASPIHRVCAAMSARKAPSGPERVDVAFLEFLPPDLPTCVAAQVASGATHITIIPMFIAQGGHLKRELPDQVRQLQSRYPEVCFDLAGAIGEEEIVVQAMAQAALARAGQ